MRVCGFHHTESRVAVSVGIYEDIRNHKDRNSKYNIYIADPPPLEQTITYVSRLKYIRD